MEVDLQQVDKVSQHEKAEYLKKSLWLNKVNVFSDGFSQTQ